MTAFDIYELMNIEDSRVDREIRDLPIGLRLRFAGHALSVNRPDVAADFLIATEAHAAECSERLTQTEVAA